ncbi:hypothetical protein P3S68_001656 [Capsicum galapagoense]
MILIDEKGNLAHAIVRTNHVTRFKHNLFEDIVNIPMNGFHFIKSELIESRVNNNTILSDVVGCLYGVGDMESAGSKWRKRDIQIVTDYQK